MTGTCLSSSTTPTPGRRRIGIDAGSREEEDNLRCPDVGGQALTEDGDDAAGRGVAVKVR
jgi:hypothetical protein